MAQTASVDRATGGRRDSDRRKAQKAFDGDDQRKGERRGGEDRRNSVRL